MSDIFSRKKRSEVMSKIRGKDTVVEKKLVSILRRVTKTRFTLNDGKVLGKPDVVFMRQKVCVFVGGDFWYGWRRPILKIELSKKRKEKIERNRRRDRNVVRNLRRQGRAVFRVWEHDFSNENKITSFISILLKKNKK